MPDYNNHLCTECSVRGVDVALSADNEAIVTCKDCALDFPPDESNRCDVDRGGEEGNNA